MEGFEGSSSSNVTPDSGSSGSDSSSSSSQVSSSNGSQSESSGNHNSMSGGKAASEPTNLKSDESDFEEVKIGSVTGKVSKAMAQAVKNLERGFHSKAQENAQVNKLMKLAQDNPKEFFKQTGRSARQFAEQVLAEELEFEAMSPAEKKARELEGQLSEYKAREAQIAEQKKQQEYQAEDQTVRNEMLGAWKDSGLPSDPKFGQWMAATMMHANAQGKSLTWQQAASIVKQDFSEHAKRVLGQLDPQGIQDLLGEGTLKKWRDFDVSRVSGQTPQKAQSGQSNSPGSKPASDKSTKNKPMSEQEYREYFKKL